MNKAFSIEHGQRIVEVTPEHRGGFRVTLYYRRPMEEMFEVLKNVALFSKDSDAQRLADKARNAKQINLANWVWQASQASPFPELQVPPKAVLETTPR